MEPTKLKITIDDVEALHVPINRKPKSELNLHDEIAVKAQAVSLALQNLNAIILDERKIQRRKTAAQKECSLAEEELRAVRSEINRPRT